MLLNTVSILSDCIKGLYGQRKASSNSTHSNWNDPVKTLYNPVTLLESKNGKGFQTEPSKLKATFGRLNRRMLPS